MADPWAEFRTSQSSAQPAAEDPWKDFRAAKPGVAEDIAKSAVGGVTRGVVGLAGLPGGLNSLGDSIVRQTAGRVANAVKSGGSDWSADTEPHPEASSVIDPSRIVPNVADVVRLFENNIVPTYRPQTTAGRYAATVGEFLPSAMVGPGTIGQKAVMGAASALGSEGAGQAAETLGAPGLAPYARFAGALAGGGASALAQRPGTAEAVISRSMQGIDDATIVAAGRLMEKSQAAGVSLTWPEAINQVSGSAATRLGNLQRVVEGSEGGASVMGPQMAQRSGQVEAAARQQFDQIVPQPANPAMIGPQIGEAAQGTVRDVQGAINNATRPLYQAAEVQRVGPQVHQALMSDPLYAQTLQEVKNNPALNRTIANMPDDAVGVVDLVQRRLREQAENAALPGQASTSNLAAANFTDARQAPVAAAETATGSRAATATQPAQVGSYEAARSAQEALRSQYLEPLMAGPIGKLAQRDITTRNAIEALFPANPLPGSAQEVLTAVQALNARNPMAARQLVRAHIESTFNEATQALQSGANQFGGAGFAAVLRGNTQQAENLAAAIQGVGGPQVLKGFDEFLDVMAATGQRQRIGSQTAFNQEVQQTLSRGGLLGEAANAVVTGGFKLPDKVRKAFERYRVGSNTEEIARLFTDPYALDLFRRLAQAAPGSGQAGAIASRLAILASTPARSSQRSDQPVP